MDGGEGGTAMQMFSTPNYTLKNGQHGKFCYVYFTTIKNYLWTLKYEFHIIFMYQNLCLLFYFNYLKM